MLISKNYLFNHNSYYVKKFYVCAQINFKN